VLQLERVPRHGRRAGHGLADDGARRVEVLQGKVSSGGVVSAPGALGALHFPGRQPPGGDGGNGNDGNGGGSGQGGHTPRPQDPGRGRGDYRGNAPAPTSAAPAGGPDLNELRDRPSEPPRSLPAPIRAAIPPICDDCYQGGGTDPEFSTARGKPENETGRQNVDLGSRNFGWSLPLVALPGRAGLDLNLTLHYNSLVWTKQGTKILFNADGGFPGPGFRLGFPVLQKEFIDQEQENHAVMLVTPSGGRVKLFRKGTVTGGVEYESVDGSYTHMIKYSAGGALVRTTDGTQYSFFDLPNGQKRCNLIKDRNGNYISISYNAANRVSGVTDTLGRVINFFYDSEGHLSQLTQSRGGSGHTDLLAQFEPGTVVMQRNFAAGLTVIGPAHNQTVAVLGKVRLPDNSFYEFHYTPFGQVWKIEHHAPDGHLLSSEGYNVPGSQWTGVYAQSDCPRFTERRDWVEYGVMQASGEVVTQYSEDSLSVCSQPPLADGTVPCKQITAPDGTIYKEFFGTTGWRKGLSVGTEVWSGGVRKKRTTVYWTHDGFESNTFAHNPRVMETNVYDEADANRRRTTIDYTEGYSLPTHVRE
jgi:YD repeat-containing protein